MIKPLTPLDVDRLKREAKRIARKLRIPLNVAYSQMAVREGFSSWELLQRAVTRRPEPAPAEPIKLMLGPRGQIGEALASHILACSLQFIDELAEDAVFRACWNGSIWISISDIAKGRVSKKSFACLGSMNDTAWRDIGQADKMEPLLNFDGLAEQFVLETDEDDEGNPVELSGDQVMFSVASGRAELKRATRWSIDSAISRLETELLNNPPD